SSAHEVNCKRPFTLHGHCTTLQSLQCNTGIRYLRTNRDSRFRGIITATPIEWLDETYSSVDYRLYYSHCSTDLVPAHIELICYLGLTRPSLMGMDASESFSSSEEA
ncbi:hypothetical protein FOZ62_010232, partial [Perkinsus olseni]